MDETSYTDAERAALAAVLDTLLPRSRDGRLPGAGELGLGAEIERDVPQLAPMVKAALARLDDDAGAGGFAGLDPAGRTEALRVHAEGDPGLLPGLLFQVYTRYYVAPAVLEALDLEPRPPWPKGYAMDPTDLDTLLEPVRAGPKRYRDA